MTRVAVVDHGMGNMRSVAKALEHVGARVEVTSDPRTLRSADKVCVPGQGVFGRCAANLRSRGIDEALRTWISDGRPYLGICLGLQVLFESSEEQGPVEGLGVIAGTVTRLRGRGVRIPHIGWNEVAGTYYYFDHSYAVRPIDADMVAGWCEHDERFAAILESDGILGVQFHPEKSGAAGLALLHRWLA